MATTAEVADAVVASLNGQVFVPPFVAERALAPVFDLADMADLHVTVVPTGRTLSPASRGGLQHDHRIDIAVQQKLTSDDPGEIDPLLALVETIAAVLARPLGPLPEARWVSLEHRPLVASEHLTELRQFTSVLGVTYRTWEPS